MIPFFAFSGLFNFISSLFLGVITYLKGKERYPSKSFVLYFFSVAFWSFGYFFWQISTDENSALFWARFLMAGAIFIPIFYFNFIVSFLELTQKYKKVLFGGYVLSVFFFLLNFTPYFVKSVEKELFFPFWPKPGLFYHPFLLMFFSYVIYSWYLLIKSLQETKEKIKKQQIKYFLLGTGIGLTGGFTNYFLWYNIPIPPYGNILVIFGVLLVTFALLKYHLFEIRVILTELLVGVMGVILLVLPFLMPTMSLKILTIAIFILFCIFGYYLIQTTHKEEKRRETAEKLTIQERALRLKIETLAKETQKLAEAKDQFLLSIQHHLRTPLTPIRGYLEMILEGSYQKEEIKDKLLAMRKSADTLHLLMEDLLDIQQIKVGKEILDLEDCQVEDLISGVVEELNPQASQKGIYLKFEKISLPKIKLDKKRIREAIWNLIDNAIKYTDKGGVKIKLEIENLNLKIAVSDTGIGMSEEEIADFLKGRLFVRGTEAKKIYGPGRGIGLAIATEFVKAHQGKIWAESKGKNLGSTFYFELPIK